nr:integrase, catalytic region, zinc finger, CCHC-type, peptidase aspartic, catalytic [Tanacetum cinerariifolium]
KEAQIKLYKTREDNELDKVIALENKVKVLDNIVYITDPFIKNTIEANFSQEIRRINAGLEQFHVCLNEEMVDDLRYFNSLELEVDSLRSQLETQKTQFFNEIDRLSKEYYYADHMNVILGVYTELDEVSNLQCDYLELLEKCECLEKKLSKRKMMSKSFETLKKHAINLEIDLQQCQEKIKMTNLLKKICQRNFAKNVNNKFKIQDLKARLQDKGIVTSELKKLIAKLKGKSVDIKTKMPIVVPVSTREPKCTAKQSVAKPLKKTVASESNQKPRNITRKLYERVSNLVEFILFIVDSGCSKHMTGNLKLLINFMEKFLGTVKFRNDQITPILGYGDLVQ